MTLALDDFAAFFTEVHSYDPFPWQKRLLRAVVENDGWPETLDLPTGSGKTAAIDVSVFHLALEASRGTARRAPVRIAFVVDRRLVVDDAFARASRLAGALSDPQGPVTARVANRLRQLAGDGPPLIAHRLRGGIPREDDWVRTPTQPTVLCSTVDQVGSRLLFRGYGVSDSMKPVHAGLIGSDCLILLDEAHLAEPFRQTLGWVHHYAGEIWRETDYAAPRGMALLTATPGTATPSGLSLNDEDRSHPVLKKRLSASKPARLIEVTRSKARPTDQNGSDDEAPEPGNDDTDIRIAAIVGQVRQALAHFGASGSAAPSPAIGVVINRVARARDTYDKLAKEVSAADADLLLLIGPARPVDRDDIAGRLATIRTDATRDLERPLILVATQCIEAGVDIDLDALVTELAPLDALRQRFGRLNRAGRDIAPYASIVATRADLSERGDDPVYGKALRPAWERLRSAATDLDDGPVVEFGLDAFSVPMDAEALSTKADAPVLLPAHLDLLSQTWPIPAVDPEIALYLHGPKRQPDSISVVWRADVDPERHRDDEDMRRYLTIVPPRSTEAIELPLWAVKNWLDMQRTAVDQLADIAAGAPEKDTTRSPRTGVEKREIFRWKGEDERSRWSFSSDLRPGDTVIVPADYGGLDAFGWAPGIKVPTTDVARKAAAPFADRRFVVRVAPGLVNDDRLPDALADAETQRWQDVRASVLGLDLPSEIREDLLALDRAHRRRSVTVHLDLYGRDRDGRPNGAIFVAPFGIDGAGGTDTDVGQPNATEDDSLGSLSGASITLAEHSAEVEAHAETFAAACLPAARVQDLKLAGFLHDAGKTDPRFQAWLHYGDPLGPSPRDTASVLAKSGRPLPRSAHAASGLPQYWRHEALSVRLAPHADRFVEAGDPELVLWLIGTHHGRGRPLFPHQDADDGRARVLPPVLGLPDELPPGAGPQSLAFNWNGVDWPSLFVRLRSRYGLWELARMEAILRLADHRASEARLNRDAPK